MTDTDLHLAKSRRESAVRAESLQDWADKGPHLDGGEIVIPSWWRHPQRVRLQRAGFEYRGGAYPGWRRKINHGKVYSSAAWLAWTLEVDVPKETKK